MRLTTKLSIQIFIEIKTKVMKTFKSLVLLFAAVLLAGQLSAANWSLLSSKAGSGNLVKEERPVSSFNSISASSGINVFIFQSDEEKVIVEADDNILDMIVTEVKGNQLNCYIDGSIRGWKKLNVYVSFKQLEEVSASSGSDLYSETIINVPNLKVSSSSGADVKLQVKVDNLRANADSGSDIVLVGTCNQFTAMSNSGSDIDGKKLVADNAKLDASSAGDIHAGVKNSIRASASSGADIVYYGNPSDKNIDRSSGGSVSAR